jgi:MraZ protein
MLVSVQSFISTTAGTLDSKGRVCIPADWRQLLAAQDTPGVYLCPSFSSPSLEGFGAEVLTKFQQQLAEQDPFFSPDFNDRAVVVMAMSHKLTFDENGRVRLPDELIAHAHLKDRVTFVGMGTKFRIWEPGLYQASLAESLKRVQTVFNTGGGPA